MLSKSNKGIIGAYLLGYRVYGGVILNPKMIPLKAYTDKYGYQQFSAGRKYSHISVHRFVAYQKYGNKIFDKDTQVRHLNGNPSDNEAYNIAIGTAHDNTMDKPKEVRTKCAIIASSKKRIFTDEEMSKIRCDHQRCGSYKRVMDKWNISSKGSLHYILNKEYVTSFAGAGRLSTRI